MFLEERKWYTDKTNYVIFKLLEMFAAHGK